MDALGDDVPAEALRCCMVGKWEWVFVEYIYISCFHQTSD